MLRKWTILLKTKVLPRWKYIVQLSFDPKHLFYTNVFTSTASFAFGDVIEQRAESLIRERKRCDFARTARMAIVGFANGIFSHFW